MINPSFKELTDISKSRYEICILISKRAKELIEGGEPLVKSKGNTPVTVALDEIMEGKVWKKKD